MEVLLAFLIGGLYAAGLYLMLGRSIGKLIVGLVLLSQAANLLIFTAGGLTRAHPPIVPGGGAAAAASVCGPHPPGAHPDRHRDRLRRSGLCPGVGGPDLSDRWNL